MRASGSKVVVSNEKPKSCKRSAVVVGNSSSKRPMLLSIEERDPNILVLDIERYEPLHLEAGNNSVGEHTTVDENSPYLIDISSIVINSAIVVLHLGRNTGSGSSR